MAALVEDNEGSERLLRMIHQCEAYSSLSGTSIAEFPASDCAPNRTEAHAAAAELLAVQHLQSGICINGLKFWLKGECSRLKFYFT